MMTSSKWKIIVIFLVENSLSYNISKFGLNWTNGFSDTKQNEIWPLTFICIWPHINLMFLCDLIVWSHSICIRNLGNLWWLVMKIWMIMWKHKMAPGWRHGWVITLKRGGARFLMMPNILWKFEHDCTVCFWDKWITKFVEKLFVYFSYKNNFSLEVICHADKLRWYASYFDMKIWPRSRHPIENWRSLFR